MVGLGTIHILISVKICMIMKIFYEWEAILQSDDIYHRIIIATDAVIDNFIRL